MYPAFKKVVVFVSISKSVSNPALTVHDHDSHNNVNSNNIIRNVLDQFLLESSCHSV